MTWRSLNRDRFFFARGGDIFIECAEADVYCTKHCIIIQCCGHKKGGGVDVG